MLVTLLGGLLLCANSLQYPTKHNVRFLSHEAPAMWALTHSSNSHINLSAIRKLLPDNADITSQSTRWAESEKSEKSEESTLLIIVTGITKSDVVELDQRLRAQAFPHRVRRLQYPRDGSVVGFVDGAEAGHNLRAVLSSDNGMMEDVAVQDDGLFAFSVGGGAASYTVNLRGPGYYLQPAQEIDMSGNGILCFKVRPMTENTFIWREDATVAGRWMMSGRMDHVEPLLHSKYGIDLVGNWTFDYATRLRRTLDQIPMIESLGKTSWTITQDAVGHDIEIGVMFTARRS